MYIGLHAPNHELEDTGTNTPPTKIISKRNLFELLGIREENFTLFMRYEPITLSFAYFSILTLFIPMC